MKDKKFFKQKTQTIKLVNASNNNKKEGLIFKLILNWFDLFGNLGFFSQTFSIVCGLFITETAL